jgi:hypothetical protein
VAAELAANHRVLGPAKNSALINASMSMPFNSSIEQSIDQHPAIASLIGRKHTC